MPSDAADTCYSRTMAGYDNLARDFSVSLIGEATLAASPVNATPRFATQVVASFASLEHQVPHVSWVEYRPAAWKGADLIRPCSYVETFDDGPGGWFAWYDNARGPRPLELRDGVAIARSPWWIDYNHAPPGAGYLHLLYMLLTRGAQGEHLNEVAGLNRFIRAGYPTDFRNARLFLRLRGELNANGTELCLLCQAVRNGICSGWLLTGQPFRVTPDWTEQTVSAVPDENQWTCLGSRHDRTDYYGQIALADVLADVNTNILLVLFPLIVVPMGPLAGDPHRLRPGKDYPVWRSRLPEGYVQLDEVRIAFPG
jgi:hypothetical protein